MWRFLSFRQLRISVTIAEIICLAKSNHVIVLASKISDSAFLRSNYDSEVTESMTFPNGTAYNVFVPSQKVRETVGSVRAKNPFESSHAQLVSFTRTAQWCKRNIILPCFPAFYYSSASTPPIHTWALSSDRSAPSQRAILDNLLGVSSVLRGIY